MKDQKPTLPYYAFPTLHPLQITNTILSSFLLPSLGTPCLSIYKNRRMTMAIRRKSSAIPDKSTPQAPEGDMLGKLREYVYF